jgi:metallo-beta-lactamase class B
MLLIGQVISELNEVMGLWNKLKMKCLIILGALLSLAGCSVNKNSILYRTETIKIERVSKNTYLHESFLHDEKWGKVSSNGLVYINNGEAVIFDAPANDSASTQLINWVEHTKNAKIKAVVVNHFHNDCLGGLGVFHEKGIESYANRRTQDLARANRVSRSIVPKNGFDNELQLKIGDQSIINKYFGEGHTTDNIVSYIPSEKVMFGGCLIKELGAKEGNLADANVQEWSNTVTKVKKEFPAVKHVIPGHGKYGGKNLLEYTAGLFER